MEDRKPTELFDSGGRGQKPAPAQDPDLSAEHPFIPPPLEHLDGPNGGPPELTPTDEDRDYEDYDDYDVIVELSPPAAQETSATRPRPPPVEPETAEAPRVSGAVVASESDEISSAAGVLESAEGSEPSGDGPEPLPRVVVDLFAGQELAPSGIDPSTASELFHCSSITPVLEELPREPLNLGSYYMIGFVLGTLMVSTYFIVIGLAGVSHRPEWDEHGSNALTAASVASSPSRMVGGHAETVHTEPLLPDGGPLDVSTDRHSLPPPAAAPTKPTRRATIALLNASGQPRIGRKVESMLEWKQQFFVRSLTPARVRSLTVVSHRPGQRALGVKAARILEQVYIVAIRADLPASSRADLRVTVGQTTRREPVDP